MKLSAKILLTGALCSFASFSHAASTLVAAWTFDTTAAAPSTPASIAASFGLGTLYGDGTHGSSTFITATTGNEWTVFGGSTVNDPRPALVSGTATAGQALSIVGGTSNSVNSKSLTFAFSLTGYATPEFSFSTRGTTTGPTSQSWSYSIDSGTTWTSFWTNTAVNTTTFVTKSTSISGSLLDGASSVWVRVTFAGATNSSGNNRIDNFVIAATAIPEPSTYATILGGLALVGVVAGRRRRASVAA